jgi:anti-sigma regulatory factor (Ser/Thr protein kinase)
VPHSLQADLTIQVDAAAFRPASEWLAATCLGWGAPAEPVDRLDLCLNEILANILEHGADAARDPSIDLHIQVSGDSDAGQALLRVSDGGVPFDPTRAGLKPRPDTLDDAEPGGLGLMLIAGNADTLAYRHEDGQNHFSVGVRWPRTR